MTLFQLPVLGHRCSQSQSSKYAYNYISKHKHCLREQVTHSSSYGRILGEMMIYCTGNIKLRYYKVASRILGKIMNYRTGNTELLAEIKQTKIELSKTKI